MDFEWIGNYDISTDELLDGMKRKSDKDRAKNYILETLANGFLDANTIYKNAYEQDISKRTLDQAKSELNVKSFKKGRTWYWKLD